MAEVLEFPQPTLSLQELSDLPQRERALDITQSWIVEAPAGSGKTGLLIQRFLKLLGAEGGGEGVDHPSQILAVTFTRKATSELRERVLAQLRDAEAQTPPANAFDRNTRPLAAAALVRDRQLGWNLLDNPARLNIRTIDSLSNDIASALPVLSGSAGALSPGEDAEALYAEAARRTVMQLGGDDPLLTTALELVLLHRDGNLANCESLIASMLSNRDQWAELVPLSPQHLDDAYLEQTVLPKLERALDLIICRALTALTPLLPEPILQSLCQLAAEMGRLDGYKGTGSPISICAGRTQSPEAKSHHLEHWRALVHLLIKSSKPRDFRKSVSSNVVGFDILRHHRTELKSIIASLSGKTGLIEALRQINSLPPAKYPADQWHITKALFRVLSRALAELQVVFAERGVCDFAEVGLLAKTALRNDSAIDDLRVAAGTHLQHLLVDEMQDTSSGQYELIRLLTASWDGRSQTAFLVGDPKQSIYLFRQARVERFVHTILSGALGSGGGALPLGVLQLTANFRSQGKLVDAFNHDFSRIFPAHPDPAQPELVPYHAASAVRPPTSGAAALVWHAHPLPNSSKPSECAASRRTQARDDASEVRRIVERWRARPLPPRRTTPWKIAVLVQARTHLPEIVKAFKRPGGFGPIPYRAVKIELLGERQEILDLLALTRALLHPADRTAWLALLRTPWCGLTLADLHQLAGQDDRAYAKQTLFQLIAERGDLLSDDGVSRLQPFWTVMNAAFEQRGRMSVSRLVSRTWQAFGARAFATEEILSNIESYLNLMDELETSEGVLDVAVLTERLKKLYAAPSVDPGAVDLMTIHNAKGLEWDVVLVPSLERIGRTSHGRLMAWLEIQSETGPGSDAGGEIAPGILAPIRGKGGPAGKLNDWIRAVESTRAAAERKRLFYVACTRAREELHLFAAPETKVNGELSVRPDSLLAAAWPAAEAHFASVQSSATVLQMPLPWLDQPLESIAASANTPRIVQRIPVASFALKTRVPGAADLFPEPQSTRAFERSEGSFSARAFGNTLHAFLQTFAKLMAAGENHRALRAGVQAWSPRISAALRSNGLAPAELDRLTQAVMRGLTRSLDDAEGQWLLADHSDSASERPVVSWSGETRSSVRLDRTFLAGPTPLTFGSTHRWIVDYKTADHAERGLDTFLAREQEKYRAQLESYAHQMPRESPPVRLALYYPMLPKLVWWIPEAAP